ncbi:hypothetical protein KBX13_09235 [Corynebacterium sp. CCUG 51687]|nr:hypothetical protein [Corynebacterium sp. CCUG 51687]
MAIEREVWFERFVPENNASVTFARMWLGEKMHPLTECQPRQRVILRMPHAAD